MGVQRIEFTARRFAPVLRLALGGRTIGLTPDHPVFTPDRGWVAAGKLAAGDRVRSHDGTPVTVEGLEADENPQVVYNLTVSGFHTFFVGAPAWGFSVWVHNGLCEDLKRLVDLSTDPKSQAFLEQAGKLRTDLAAAKATGNQKALAEFEATLEGMGANGKAALAEAKIDYAAIQAPVTEIPTRGMGGRMLSAVEQGEFTAFGQRAQRVGLIENPNRTGSWGRITDGKFQEITRIDVAEAGKPGWRGQTHIHIEGQQGHLNPNTPLPGE